jgi:prepilin signal peptidase PulO-like enzyme (type II secretory pathway)
VSGAGTVDVVGLGVLFLVHLLGKPFVRIATRAEARSTRPVAFGLGDVRLGGLAALILGFPQVLLALLLAVLLGGVAALVCLLLQAIHLRRFARFAPMPYAPYLVAGTMVTMFFGPEIGRWLPEG